MAYFFSIFFGTFVLEDIALLSAITLATQNKITISLAFLACFLGISVGDLLLYAIGNAISRLGLEKKYVFLKKIIPADSKINNSSLLKSTVLISRFIPGTRLPTYITAGFIRFSLTQFFILTLLSVFIWVLIAFSAGSSIFYWFQNQIFLSLTLLFLLIKVIQSLIPKLLNHWDRKALLYSWQKWKYFEFWPAHLFYLPMVPIYIFYGIKYRNLFLPFYAHPDLENGGLIGESKWDFLRHLSANDPSTLKTVKVNKSINANGIFKIIKDNSFTYPFIIKPDVGQRGFAVRIIHDESELINYLEHGKFDKLIQSLSLLTNESGIFYIRKPSEKFGKIFSLTDKKFPFVVGDGQTRLGDLILKDSRARIIAAIYFSRHIQSLDSIPIASETVQLSDCGNHCQGAIFLNGQNFITDELTLEIDRIAKQIPHFYFGRFDVRYFDADNLKMGKKFEIVEVNGAGSEATHIWDRNTKIFDAYKVLFMQWGLLFDIGSAVKANQISHKKISLLSLLKESWRVYSRKHSLSVSS